MQTNIAYLLCNYVETICSSPAVNVFRFAVIVINIVGQENTLY